MDFLVSRPKHDFQLSLWRSKLNSRLKLHSLSK
jgi:hypothetical protein